MDPLQAISLFKPIKPLTGIEQVGGGKTAKPVQPAVGEGYNPFGAISKIDGELTPTYAQKDSSYTNGLGHSVHKFMLNA